MQIHCTSRLTCVPCLDGCTQVETRKGDGLERSERNVDMDTSDTITGDGVSSESMSCNELEQEYEMSM